MADAKDKVVDINAKKDFDAQEKRYVMDCYKRMNDLKAERTSINEQMGAVMAEMEAKGYNKKAIKAGFGFLDMDDDKRTNFDNTMIMIRQAGGQPLQADLFGATVNASFLRSEGDEPKMEKVK